MERLGKRAHLTQAGEKLIEHARHLLDEDARTRSSMRRFSDKGGGRVRIGTSMTMLMYALPPILRKLKTSHPQLEINLKAGLTAATLKMLKANALDLGLCALPVEDPAFETVPLFDDELVAILPAAIGPVPKKVTPAFLAQRPLILGNEDSALRRDGDGVAGAGRSAAEAGDDVRQRRGDQEPGRGRARRVDRPEPVPRRRARADGEHGRRAAQPAREPPGRPGATARQARHRGNAD